MDLTFGEYLRSLRIDKGLTQTKLAKRLGVTNSYVSMMEGDRLIPSEGVIRDLAIVFKVPSDRLFLLAGRVPKDREREAAVLLFGGTENR